MTNELLLSVAAQAEQQPAWVEYAAYCRLQEKGLRKHAFRHLDVFIQHSRNWSLEQRTTFVDWLCSVIATTTMDPYGVIPFPLEQRLLRPTLQEWMQREPHHPAPYRWMGLFFTGPYYSAMRAGFAAAPDEARAYLQHALRLDPTDQHARVRLIEILIGDCDYHAHHLPEEYLGDPAADLQELEDAEHLVPGLTNDDIREQLQAEIADVRQVIHDWLVFKQ